MDYNRFEQNDILVTNVSDNIFNNPGQSTNKPNIVTHNQYGMRWYLFMVWGFMIYYFITTVEGAIKYFSQLDSYLEIMKRWDDSYYTYMFVVTLLTAVCEAILAFLILRARKGLLELKKKGIKDLYICLIAPIVYCVLYIVGFLLMVASEDAGEVGEFFKELFSVEFITYGGWKIILVIAAYIGFIIGNVKYFNNRKHFFVN